MSNDTNDVLAAFYGRRHPEYDNNVEHWRFFRSCYDGGRAWFEKNIHRYHKEGPTEFAERKERAYRFNHTREVVDLVQKYLFKGKVARNTDEAPEEVKAFWKNATLSGLDIGQLIRTSSTANSQTGRVAIVIDNNMPAVSEGKVLSKAEVKNLKARVYGYVVQTEDILDYAWDEEGDGGLLWIKLAERVRLDRDPINDTGDVVQQVRLWTRDQWVLYRVRLEGKGKSQKEVVEEVERRTHGLGVVPVILHDHMIGDFPYHVPGLIEDIAFLDRAVANYLSNLDAIIQDQTFSQLAIPSQALPPGEDPMEKALNVGTKRIFVYDAGSGSTAKPEFLSPDPKQAGVILDQINKIINEIYHTIGLAGERTKEDNSVGIDNSSGVAKAYDFERVNSLLLSKATSCERVENKIVELVMLWHGKPAPEEKLVTYPTTFDVMRLADDLIVAETLAKIEAPIVLRREHMKTVADGLFPQVKEDLRTKVDKDIDGWLEGTDILPLPTAAGAGARPVAAPKRQGQVTRSTPK